MTSEPIEAYGGMRFPASVLRSFADQANGEAFPWHADHDLTKPVRIRDFVIFTHDRSDGVTELRFRAEMHPDDVHLMGTRPGMSATVMSPLPRDENLPERPDAPFRLSADHAWFDDEALIAAEEKIISLGVPGSHLLVQRAYQFAWAPDPQIFMEISGNVLLSVGASALWDAIKLLFRRRRTPPGGVATKATTINFDITDGQRSLRAVVKTNDPEVARRAIESLDSVASEFAKAVPPVEEAAGSPAETLTWDDPSRRWTPPG
ncbi:hypothetical protein AB1K56_11800 [Microbacterium sp. BWR-S6Y]|uniref:hypothetical protein n=1 Tax=Microbacterium sp. BWR-S6Y TaxID=3232073 RepID=UPI00352938CC